MNFGNVCYLKLYVTTNKIKRDIVHSFYKRERSRNHTAETKSK